MDVYSFKIALFPSKPLLGFVNQNSTNRHGSKKPRPPNNHSPFYTALFTTVSYKWANSFQAILQATWVATFALFIGICFVLTIIFSADGKPTSSKWYEYTRLLLLWRVRTSRFGAALSGLRFIKTCGRMLPRRPRLMRSCALRQEGRRHLVKEG